MRIETGTQNLDATIRECYASDPAYLDKWCDGAPCTLLDDAVSRTIRDIESRAAIPSFKFYRAHTGKELAGFWGVDLGRYIDIIYVKPEFRCGEFWDAIEGSVETMFFSTIDSKNKPALEFFAKYGIRVKERTNGQGYPETTFAFIRGGF